MSNWFNRKVKVPSVRHSLFDESTDYKTSFNFGQLIPHYVEDCVPSDKFKTLSSECFIRLAPMTFPIMHRLKVRQHFFVVPYRLVLGDQLYEDFLNGKKDIMPLKLQNDNQETYSFKNTLIDYMGYFWDYSKLDTEYATEGPLELISTFSEKAKSDNSNCCFTIPNPIAILAVLLVWKNYYADEVLHESDISLIDNIIDGYRNQVELQQTFTIDLTSSQYYKFDILPVSFTKDYFTSAQTDVQRGTEVYLESPVYSNYAGSPSISNLNVAKVTSSVPQGFRTDGATGISIEPTSRMSIAELWQAEQIKRFEEVDNVFGTRIFEKLAGHWGVISSDARLQKPQLIGGQQSFVNISEILQTSSSVQGSALGSYAGKGINFSRTKSTKVFIEEHSFVFGFTSIIPDNGYTQGCPRYFYKQNIFDFASPEFNNIGYQPVYKGELFNTGVLSDDIKEFGYQPRYSEYRSHPSIATGDFRDNTLMSWHLDRYFADVPELSKEFIEATASNLNRIFNNTSGVHFYMDAYTKSIMSRPISYMPSSHHL